MHATYSHRENTYIHKTNLSTVKWAQRDKTQSRELLGLFICVCIALCTIVAHNNAQNRPDNFPSYPPDNHHCSDDVYLREGGSPDSDTWARCHCRGNFGGVTKNIPSTRIHIILKIQTIVSYCKTYPFQYVMQISTNCLY